MSLRVELARLLEVAGGFGTVPMLLTVDDDGRPRAAAVTVGFDGAEASGTATDPPLAQVAAGRRSLANAGARPLVSLLWPAPAGERFALLVDGETVGTEVTEPADPDTGKGGGGVVVVRPTSAILHVVTAAKKRPKGQTPG